MQFSNVTLALLIFIHAIRWTSAHEAAPQLSNDTTNRKFHPAILGSHHRDGVTTWGMTTRSDWLLRTPPTQSGVFAAVRGHSGLVGGYQGPGATLARPAQAQLAIEGKHTPDNKRPVPPIAGQAKLHCTAQHPAVDRAGNITCTRQPMQNHPCHVITSDTHVNTNLTSPPTIPTPTQPMNSRMHRTSRQQEYSPPSPLAHQGRQLLLPK